MTAQIQQTAPTVPKPRDAMAELPSGVTVATCRNVRA